MQTYPTATNRPMAAQSSAASRLSGSFIVWLALMAYLAAVKLVITFAPTTFRSVSQGAVFAWPAIGIWTAAGLAGIWLSRRTGFPDAWDQSVSLARRFGLPVLLGLAFGVAFVVVDVVTRYSALYVSVNGQPRMNIDFPASALIYPGGAVIVEVVYRLLIVPLLLWLISSVMLRGRRQTQVFWVLAALASLIEPMTQDLDLVQFGSALLVPVFALDYSINLTQAVLFRKYGFLAAIVLRVAFYVIWHMVYVH